MVHPDPRTCGIKRDSFYYFDCATDLHPGKTCNEHQFAKLYLMIWRYGKLFLFVRLLPGLISVIVRKINQLISKFKKGEQTENIE